MTSAFTHAETLAHFEQHNYFGLEPSQVRDIACCIYSLLGMHCGSS
jgi:UDP-N-acetylglucosamine pyrophosphorylase